MDATEPDITVVIATRNRSSRLGAALASLRAQTLARERFEVIVVDDRSTDDTQAVLAAEHELPLRALHGEGGGPGGVRNVGWPEARGPLVAFTDDDCEPEPHWLSALLDAWEGDPGRFLQGSTVPIEREVDRQGLLAYTYDIRALDVNFPCCNMAYPKALLARVGGFDAEALPRTGEDCDLAWRAVEAGAEPRFVPEALVRHAVVRMEPVGCLRRAWSWGYAMPAFARHPQLRRRRLIKRVFFNWSHWYLLRLLVALTLPRGRALWPLKLWLGRRYVEDRRWAPGSDRPSARALAWNLVVDTIETAAVVQGSLRHGTLVL